MVRARDLPLVRGDNRALEAHNIQTHTHTHTHTREGHEKGPKKKKKK